MEPTIPKGSSIVVNPWAYSFVKPARWDIVAFKSSATRNIVWVFRVVGLPGEKVHIDERAVFINGVTLEIPSDLKALKHLPGELVSGQQIGPPFKTYEVPSRAYFLLGDNTRWSNDSRFAGAVSESDIIGKVIGE